MKTEEEMKIWFFKMMEECFTFVHKDYSDFIYYRRSENHLMRLKINSLLEPEEQEIIKPILNDGIILFKQDSINNLLLIDFDEIWSVFENNLDYKYNQITDLIIGWFSETQNLKQYTPTIGSYNPNHILGGDSRFEEIYKI